MKKIAATILVVCSIALSGCQTTESFSSFDEAISARPIRISAIGHGAMSSYDGYTAGQKRLMAMRASKLDAYRSLAEQVYGIRLTGNTTVSAMMAQNDSFRVYIDAYLRGARVQSITPMADGNYETVLEMDFDERLARERFLRPAPGQPQTAPPPLPRQALKGVTGSGAAYGSTFYYAE